MSASPVSVVILSSNTAPFLSDAVASALDQTPVSIGVLVVDDGSSQAPSSREGVAVLLADGPPAASVVMGARPATREGEV